MPVPMRWRYLAIRHIESERILGIYDTEEEAWDRCLKDKPHPAAGASYSVRRKRSF